MAKLVTLSKGNAVGFRYITNLCPRIYFLAIGRRFLTRLRRDRLCLERDRGQPGGLDLEALFRSLAVRLRFRESFRHGALQRRALLGQSLLVRFKCRDLVCQLFASVLFLDVRLLGSSGGLAAGDGVATFELKRFCSSARFCSLLAFARRLA